MKFINRLKILFLFAIILIITSCGGNKHKGYTKQDNSFYSKFHIKTDGEKAIPGDIITLDIRYGSKDSVIFDSEIMNTPFRRELIAPEFAGDIYDCIQMMSLGDSASFIIKADSFYLKTARMEEIPLFFKDKNDLYVDLYLKEVLTREEAVKQVQDQISEFKEAEQKTINEYLTSKNASLDNEGIYFEETRKGSRVKPKDGQMIRVHYELEILGGAVFFSTKTNRETVDFEFNSVFETNGFQIALRRMSKGSKAEFMVPSNLAFGEEGSRGQILPYSPLLYKLEVIDVLDKEAYESKKQEKLLTRSKDELKKITKYLKDNNLSNTPSTESGLFYIETLKGNGPRVKSGDKVKVHYTLYLLNGKKLDSSVDKGIPYDVTVDQTSVIKGWHEALKLMNVGSKADVLIPSVLAYGDRQRSEDILPFTPLLFKLELIEIVE